jgi:hypothetical protein
MKVLTLFHATCFNIFTFVKIILISTKFSDFYGFRTFKCISTYPILSQLGRRFKFVFRVNAKISN